MVEQNLANNVIAECEQVLGKVVSVYQAMQKAQQQLNRQLDSNRPASSFQAMDLISRLSAAASEYDRLLVAKLAIIQDTTPQLAALFARRHQLLEELKSYNDTLSARACNVKALLQHQMTSFKDNNRALDGYRSGTAQGGRIMATRA